MDEQAIKQWHCLVHHGRRGRGFHYSDTAIETALMLKGLFKLPLRALEGFMLWSNLNGHFDRVFSPRQGT
nr:Transposase [Klebsiella pneumoniae]